MSLGPVEMLAVKFPGNQFKGEIIPALTELVENNTIRIIDILFIKKDAEGNLTVLEINELDDDTYEAFDPVVAEIEGLLAANDALILAQSIENNSSAALMLFENVWATRFRDAVLNANGKVMLSERVPHHVVDLLKS